MTEQKNYYINPISQPLPEGYLFSPNVLNMLIPKMWGDRAELEPTFLLGFGISRDNVLGDVERTGQVQLAAQCILEALRNRTLECCVQNSNGNFDVISHDIWNCTPDRYASELLASGEVFDFWVEALSWADGRAILFERSKVNDWLNGYTSDHLLPNPPKRSADTLPDEQRVSLCELATWLSDDAPITNEMVSEQFRIGGDKMKRGVNDALDKSIVTDQEGLDFQIFLATEAARDVRLSLVADEITGKISSGKIQAYGRSNIEGSQTDLLKVPPTVFLGNLGLFILPNCIDADGSGSQRDFVAARKSGYYGIRFIREDVIAVWGVDAGVLLRASENLGSKSVLAPPKTVHSIATIRAAYVNRCVEWPEGKFGPSREDDYEWGAKTFGAAQNTIKDLRREYAPKSWKEAGRRRAKN